MVPRDVMSHEVFVRLIDDHVRETGKNVVHAAVDVASTIDWFAWCVFMGNPIRWRPTRNEQDPVWHNMIGKPYMEDLMGFLGKAASPGNGVRRDFILEHVVDKSAVENDVIRPINQLAVMAMAGVPLASFMHSRVLAECESAIRYSGR